MARGGPIPPPGPSGPFSPVFTPPIRFPVPPGNAPGSAPEPSPSYTGAVQGQFMPTGLYPPFAGGLPWYPYGYQQPMWPMQPMFMGQQALVATTTTTTVTVTTSSAHSRRASSPSRSSGSESRDGDAVSLAAPSEDTIVREGRNISASLPKAKQKKHTAVTMTTATVTPSRSQQVPGPSGTGLEDTQPSPPGTPTPSEVGGDEEETDSPQHFTFAKAVNEVFRFLPEEACPRIPSTSSRKFGGFLDAASGLDAPPQMHLPMPPLVESFVASLEEAGSRAESQAWSVPRSVLTSNLKFNWKAYKFSQEAFPLSVPPLDEDAARLGIKAPPSLKVPAKSLSKWESRARQLLGICSYNNAFVGALHVATQQDTPPLVSIQLLVEALNQSSRHASALAISLAAEMLQARREDILASSTAISENGKRKLRSAPLASKTLFGGLVSDVAEAEHTDSLRRAAASKSTFKRPAQPSSSKKKGGDGKSDSKKARPASPLMSVQPPPARGFQRGNVGRGRGSSSPKSPFTKKQP